jgi:uncharacterized heparinase superfamily protein
LEPSMPQLTLAEQARLALLATDRARRTAMARFLGSRLLRWRYGAPVADELLIIPQDLRTADPSFANELEHGQFGFGGTVAFIGAGSPFDLEPPSAAWQRALHGFGWLRHLRAAGHPAAREMALAIVRDWIRRHGSRRGVPWEPQVIGRRLMSWIANAAVLLDGVDATTYDRTANSLGDQLIHLAATWRDAPDGGPRLLALTALVLADLCVAGHDRHLREIEADFAAELNRQILPDGGHVSRNPRVLVELLLDFLPLRQCFAVRSRTPPAALDAAIGRMMPMLRFMRLGNGTLARFNGMGASTMDALATVLAYDDATGLASQHAQASGYARLERGETVLIVDVGPPPPLELSGKAHAGCLSFEMSSGRQAIFVNGGCPGPADQDWRAAARATASHNTVCLAGHSSGKIVRHELLERLVGAPPIRLPDHVVARIDEGAAGIMLEASHDGYLRRFQLLHRRWLRLDASGLKLDGRERLGPARGQLRLSIDVPFAVHFHLHPEVTCAAGASPGTAELTLRDGQRWRFAADGTQLSIEESIHYADLSGPRRSLQIVLRGACFGDNEVRWTVERLTAPGGDAPGAGDDPASRQADGAA